MSATYKDFKYTIDANKLVSKIHRRTKRVGFSFKSKKDYERHPKYQRDWQQDS